MDSKIITRLQQDAMERCIARNIPFALYALPNSAEATFIASMPTDDEYLNDHEPEPGAFAVTFFNRETPRPVVILPRMSAARIMELPASAGRLPDADISPASRPVQAVTYLAQVHEMVRCMKRVKGKVVLSRLIAGKSGRPIATIAREYFAGQQSTFRYLFFTQETGLWLGATPELLLRYTPSADQPDTGEIDTMSLAGTRSSSDDSGEWDPKNIREQSLVTDYVTGAISALGLPEPTLEQTTMRLNDIEHICTRISTTGTAAQAADLGTLLDPTPAVAGYPKETALALIRKYEAHERLCYAGTITVYNRDNAGWSTFVNLRCAFLAPDDRQDIHKGFSFNIYAGGGLTHESVPADEWMETQLKAQRLMSALSGTEAGHLNDIQQQLSEEATS